VQKNTMYPGAGFCCIFCICCRFIRFNMYK